MLNLRVFALVALATFGVAALLRALGPGWVVRRDVAQTFAQGAVETVTEKLAAQAALAPALVERAHVSGAASPGAVPEVADRGEGRLQSAESRPARSSAVGSAGRRSSKARLRSRAVLVRAAAPPSGELQAEQRQLKVVQKALEKGRGAAAARALDDLGPILPSGELGLEAELLRIDVALARGERDRALELARAFDSRPGAERYKERLGALIGGTKREEPHTALMGSR